MSDFKFIVVPGFVLVGDKRQFMDIKTLAKLYGLLPGEWDGSTVPAERSRFPKHWVRIGPRPRGDYAEHIATLRAGATPVEDLV